MNSWIINFCLLVCLLSLNHSSLVLNAYVRTFTRSIKWLSEWASEWLGSYKSSICLLVGTCVHTTVHSVVTSECKARFKVITHQNTWDEFILTHTVCFHPQPCIHSLSSLTRFASTQGLSIVKRVSKGDRGFVNEWIMLLANNVTTDVSAIYFAFGFCYC